MSRRRLTPLAMAVSGGLLAAAAPAGPVNPQPAEAWQIREALIGRSLGGPTFARSGGEWILLTGGGPETFCPDGSYQYKPDFGQRMWGRYRIEDGSLCVTSQAGDVCRDVYRDGEGSLWMKPSGDDHWLPQPAAIWPSAAGLCLDLIAKP